MRPLLLLTGMACLLACARTSADEGKRYTAIPTENGTVHFAPAGDQQDIPERYRLNAHAFDFVLTFKKTLNPKVDVYDLRFPSPFESACKENNTVYAEYYRPREQGPFP